MGLTIFFNTHEIKTRRQRIGLFNAAAFGRGLLRVAPGEPDRSFLLIKLVGPGGPNWDQAFGSQMPLIGGPLTGPEIDLVRRWIEQGANP